MAQTPLVSREIDEGAELVREFDRLYPVQSAFWLKASDEEYRYLYIASENIHGANQLEAYQAVSTVVRQSALRLDPFRVRVIDSDHPLARAAADFHRRYPSPIAARFGESRFGGETVDDVYLYPSPLPASTS